MTATADLVVAFEKQLFFLGLVQERPSHFDRTTGLLSFGDQHRWQTQIIGTVSEASNTWRWAWANAELNIPPHLLVVSLALKAHGKQNGIPEFTQPELPLAQFDGDTLALHASSACEADAYYRCPHEGGALYVLIMDDNFPECADEPLQRVVLVFPQAIASLDISDHEEALCGYLDHHGLEHEHDDNQIVVRDEDDEPVLTATFDEQRRLTKLEARLEPEAPEDNDPGESWDEGQLRRMLGW